MIRTVSTWRCKCGVRLKVVGETAKGHLSVGQPAICPNCGDKQTVYSDKIVSTEIETTGQDSFVPPQT